MKEIVSFFSSICKGKTEAGYPPKGEKSELITKGLAVPAAYAVESVSEKEDAALASERVDERTPLPL